MFNGYTFVDTLTDTAKKSDMMFKHSACLYKSGILFSTGFNTIYGYKSYHAEINAIKNYLKSHNIFLSPSEIGLLESKGSILWKEKTD